MNRISILLRQLGGRFLGAMRHFLTGRYCQHDKLNIAILFSSFALIIASTLVGNPALDLVLHLGAYGLLILSMVRFFSHKTYKRYEENRRFLLWTERLGDKRNRYFNCPKCRQTVRVPKNKGKIAITCPKCGEKFIKKT